MAPRGVGGGGKGGGLVLVVYSIKCASKGGAGGRHVQVRARVYMSGHVHARTHVMCVGRIVTLFCTIIRVYKINNNESSLFWRSASQSLQDSLT